MKIIENVHSDTKKIFDLGTIKALIEKRYAT